MPLEIYELATDYTRNLRQPPVSPVYSGRLVPLLCLDAVIVFRRLGGTRAIEQLLETRPRSSLASFHSADLLMSL